MENKTEKVKNYFNYNRKSTENAERQVLSIPAQIEWAHGIAKDRKVNVKAVFSESKSAKVPDNRPLFTEMVIRIKKGEAIGIICWKMDRLARNPEEAGIVLGMLKRGEIQHIITNEREYRPEDNAIISYVDFGMADQYVRDLSRNVKRGMDKKAAMGWRPGRAPLGYLNSKTKLQGEQDISNDPERFELVKQLLRTMLTGNYTRQELLEYANNDMGLTVTAMKTKPARKLHMSELYRILTNPFYYGWYAWPENSENWIEGKHEPMITMGEYDRIQFLLGRKGRPRPKTHKFAFTGTMRCGQCGCAITAEERWKKQKNGNVHNYIYYHCTRKTHPRCSEKSIELDDFNAQFDELLAGITISEKFKNWAIKYLHEIRKEEAVAQEFSLEAAQKALAKVVKDLDNLVLLFTCSENAKRELLTTEEFLGRKSELLKEKAAMEAKLKKQGVEIEDWVELSEKTFNFACYAHIWFQKGDPETKRAIFACISSNPLLKAKQLSKTLKKPFESVKEKRDLAEKELEWFVPLKVQANTISAEDLRQKFPVMSG